MSSKSVVIADDHPFTTSGMAAALKALGGFEIAGIASNGIEAIALIKKLRPDCAVLDLTMPGANGLEVFLEARRWSPETRIAVVTGHPSPALLQELAEASVEGIFLKNAPVDEICNGIRDIAFGGTKISKDAQDLMQSGRQGELLTARELEVLQSIALGLSNNQTATRLGVSPKTVDTHRTNLMRKLGVHSTATLLVRAMRQGLIDVADDA